MSTTLRKDHASLRSLGTLLPEADSGYLRGAFQNGCNGNVGVELTAFNPCSTAYMTFHHGSLL